MADYSLILRDDSVKARFWRKVDKRGPDECWPWKDALSCKGYGTFKNRTIGHPAHRVSLMLSGAVPKDGDVTDHICRNKGCVNPRHLRFVTQQKNATENSIGIAAINLAKTHCKRGHELTGWNLIVNAIGNRVCRECAKTRSRDYMRERKAKARALQAQAQF